VELEQKGYIKQNSGYRDVDENGNAMAVFHVDTCHLFEERANDGTKFGGNLSVRKKQEGKPCIMFGHNQCIFKQYTLTKKHWRAPNGAVIITEMVRITVIIKQQSN
jgi:hypothetical protein